MGVIFIKFIRSCVSLLLLLIFLHFLLHYLEVTFLTRHCHEFTSDRPDNSLATHHSLIDPPALHWAALNYLKYPVYHVLSFLFSFAQAALSAWFFLFLFLWSTPIHPLTQEAQSRSLSYVLTSGILILVTCSFSSWEEGMRRKEIFFWRNANECFICLCIFSTLI